MGLGFNWDHRVTFVDGRLALVLAELAGGFGWNGSWSWKVGTWVC